MNIELSIDNCEKVTTDTLRSSIEDIAKMIKANFANEHELLEETFVPMYSYDFVEEDEKLNKLLKAFVKVHNWYAGSEERIKL